jgi:hypothetical protein
VIPSPQNSEQKSTMPCRMRTPSFVMVGWKQYSGA